MPPKSEPVQSALAPKPRGILKNAKPPADPQEKNNLQWDESNLSLNQEERDQAGARMTIDEPKTPFVHSAPAPPMEEEPFDLDRDEEPPTSLDNDKVLANTQANAAISASYQQLKEQLAASSAPPMRGDGDDDEEDATKHAEFNRKRNQHYGNEAAALKQAAALAAEDEADA